MYVWLRGLNALLLCQLVQSSGFYSVRVSKFVIFGLADQFVPTQRPDIKAPKVTVHVNNIEANENDLLFLTPYFSHQDGRFIYNLRGVSVYQVLCEALLLTICRNLSGLATRILDQVYCYAHRIFVPSCIKGALISPTLRCRRFMH